MSTILDEIVANRKAEVSKSKLAISPGEIKERTDLKNPRNSLSEKLLGPGSSGII
jgi:hypothetical protein